MSDEPAFPCTTQRNTSSDPLATPRAFNHPGMTLRDWFAGQALIGWLSNQGGEARNGHPDVAAVEAYQYADAMLMARDDMFGPSPHTRGSPPDKP